MYKAKLLCLGVLIAMFSLCGLAFAGEPAILASMQERHDVSQADDAILAEAKGADYQIRWKRFQFGTNYKADSRSYNPAYWNSAGFEYVISYSYTGHVQADVVSRDILGNYTNNPNFGPYGSQWGTQWASHW